MDVEESVLVVHLYRQYVKKRKRKRYWVHPILQARSTRGQFFTFFCELRQYEEKFFNYTRMSVASFDELLNKMADSIRGIDTAMRSCIGPEEKLLVTLRYLATGNSFVDLHHCYRLGVTTIKEIVTRVCSAMWNVLKNDCLPEPSKDDWLRIATEFEKRANFPNCIGAVDGKHIRMVKPSNSASLYFNYKNYFSIVLMAVTDADYKFVFIDVGSYGKCGDSTIFQQSVLYQRILAGTIDLPEDRPISSSVPTPIPFVFLADDAFSLSHRVMCPFIGKHLDESKRIFNYRHCRGRRYVECTFGILANKWRIFHRALNVNIDLAINIVKACCILHNYVRSRDGVQFVDTLYSFPSCDNECANAQRTTRQYNSNTRNTLAGYFRNEGAVPWQEKYI